MGKINAEWCDVCCALVQKPHVCEKRAQIQTAGRPTPPAPALPTAWWMNNGEIYRTTIADFLEKTEAFQVLSDSKSWVICEARRIISELLRSSAAPPRAQTPEQIELWRCERCWQWLRVAYDGCACTTVDVPCDPSERTVGRYFASKNSVPSPAVPPADPPEDDDPPPSVETALRDLIDAIPESTLADDPPLECWIKQAERALAARPSSPDQEPRK